MNNKSTISLGWLLAGLLVLSGLLTACGDDSSGPLLADVTAEAGTLDLTNGANQLDAVGVSYRIGRPAQLSARLEGANGQVYPLRQSQERSPGTYTLRLSGAIETVEEGLPQIRLLPNGTYKYVLQAVAGGATSEASGRLNVINNPAGNNVPRLEGLSVNPSVISPNFDARDDTAFLGWRTTQPATVQVSVTGGDSFSKILKTVKNQPAQEDKVVFNGLDQRGDPLPDGTYTYTVQATDQWGNVTRRAGKVVVKGGGKPTASIQQASIGPTEIIKGNLITVTVRVKNTGLVPIRSQGPDSGFVYSTRDVYSSVEGGKYNDAAGFWRVGVDYESNSGGGAARYPFRWGFGREVLQPGEEVEVVGQIKVERNEEKLRFYVGLIQEQIGLPQDHIQITQVKISY